MRPAESFISQPIRSLQTMLRVISAQNGQRMSVVPDGIYGRQTMAAVSDFQRKKGLPVTGITDQPTWEAIVAAYDPAIIDVGPAQPIAVVFNPNEVIHRGEYSPNVYLAQGMLLILAEVYGSIGMPSLNGIIDFPTADSLSSFQMLNALPMTGELDKRTWKHLSLHYPLAANLHKRRKIGH